MTMGWATEEPVAETGVCWEDQEGWMKIKEFRSRKVRLEVGEE